MINTSHDVRCVWPAAAALGEGPLWLADEAALYWVDIVGADLLRYTPATGRSEKCRLPFAVSAVVPVATGNLLCTAQRDLYQLDAKAGRLFWVRHVDIDDDRVRINDGGCHPDGAFWFGSMDIAERRPVGDFYRLASDGACERIPASYVITNGPAFSSRGDSGYFVDTLDRRILRTSLGTGGSPLALHEFARIPEEEGFPDGLAVDAEGGVWCAHWGGARVTRFDATGRVTDVIHLPVSNVTKCAFGGDRLDHLFITTARKGLDGHALNTQPLAGGLFVAEVGYRGVPASFYRGEHRLDAATSCTCFFESL